MDKVIIRLYVPCVNQRFDVKIPIGLNVKEAVFLIANSVEKLTDGKYLPNGDELLCNRERNCILSSNHQIKDYGIQNGDELILI